MKKFVIAAALGASMLAGAAYAAPQDSAAPRRANPMAMMDADKDGVITRAEALAAADRQFNRMDQNKDGKLEASEMRRPHHRGRGGAERAAPTAPTATDGTATADKRMHHRGGKGGRMLERVDTNKDGAISREEFRAAAAARFERMDANRDGRIDAAEQSAMRERMKARGARHAQSAAPTGTVAK
jgi:hypothetical protein